MESDNFFIIAFELLVPYLLSLFKTNQLEPTASPQFVIIIGCFEFWNHHHRNVCAVSLVEFFNYGTTATTMFSCPGSRRTRLS